MEKQEHWRKLMDINYLGSYSLPMGQDVVLTIKGFDEGEAFNLMKGKTVKVKVILFEEDYEWVRPWIVSAKANMKAIESATGTFVYSDWVGKKIRIGVEKVKVKGEIIDALRVKNVSSQSLKEEYDAILAQVDKATTQDQIKDIIAIHAHFKPFDTVMKNKINEQWTKLKPKQ